MRVGVTAEVLKEYLQYSAVTGEFVWIKATSRNRQHLVGKIAGSLASTGYVVIKLLGTSYLAHRLAWLYMTGQWPMDHLDHRSRIRNDNRWDNLREGGFSPNAQNRPGRAGSKTGLKGVSLAYRPNSPRPFVAKIGAAGQVIRLGRFATAQEAHEAYCDAARRHHGQYVRLA